MRTITSRTRFSTATVLSLALAAAAIAGSAGAAVNTWIGPATGDWNNGSNWSDGVPTSDDEVIINNGAQVTLTTLTTISTLTIDGGNELLIRPPGRLNVAGGPLHVDGVIRVNPFNQTPQATLAFIGDTDVTGDGDIVMNGAFPFSQVQVSNPFTATIGAGIEVSGRGGVTGTGTFVNNGVVRSTITNNFIVFSGGVKENNNLIEAAAGGVSTDNTTVQGTGELRNSGTQIFGITNTDYFDQMFQGTFTVFNPDVTFTGVTFDDTTLILNQDVILRDVTGNPLVVEGTDGDDTVTISGQDNVFINTTFNNVFVNSDTQGGTPLIRVGPGSLTLEDSNVIGPMSGVLEPGAELVIQNSSVDGVDLTAVQQDSSVVTVKGTDNQVSSANWFGVGVTLDTGSAVAMIGSNVDFAPWLGREDASLQTSDVSVSNSDVNSDGNWVWRSLTTTDIQDSTFAGDDLFTWEVGTNANLNVERSTLSDIRLQWLAAGFVLLEDVSVERGSVNGTSEADSVVNITGTAGQMTGTTVQHVDVVVNQDSNLVLDDVTIRGVTTVRGGGANATVEISTRMTLDEAQALYEDLAFLIMTGELEVSFDNPLDPTGLVLRDLEQMLIDGGVAFTSSNAQPTIAVENTTISGVDQTASLDSDPVVTWIFLPGTSSITVQLVTMPTYQVAGGATLTMSNSNLTATTGTVEQGALYRFFGDVTGNTTIDVQDFNAFGESHFRDATSRWGDYSGYFDFDGDGNIGAADFFQFRDRTFVGIGIEPLGGSSTIEAAVAATFDLTDETQWSWGPQSALAMTGGVGAQTGQWENWGRLEVGGTDLGTDSDNHQGDPLGFDMNFDLSILRIGPGAHVYLEDLIDNGNRNGPFGPNESLYVDVLEFADSAGLLNLNGLHLYFGSLVGDPAQIIDVEVSAGEIAAITNYTMIKGTRIGGGIPELLDSDDQYFHTRSGFGQTFIDLHHMEVHIDLHTDVAAPSLLDLVFESRIEDTSGIAQVRLFNWSTGQFELIGSHPLGVVDQVRQINDVNAANYINAQGDFRLSIKHIVFVPLFAYIFESLIDQAEIRVE